MQNSIKTIVKSDSLSELNHAVQKLFGSLPSAALICDNNTYKAAGEKVESIYQGLISTVILGSGNDIISPEEPVIGELVLKIPDNIELFIACGSGVINDITRFISYKLQKPFISIATACSMDGYASPISPLVLNNLKHSYPAVPPRIIFADTNILVKAPIKMISAGFGDIIGKLIAKTDWYLSNTINGEPVNQEALELMDEAVLKCINLVNKENSGQKTEINTPAVVEALMNGLITAGKSMTIAGNSRPASGSEHLISHFLGMKSLFKQAPHHLHGTKVAFGTFQMAKLYWKVFSLDFADFNKVIQEVQYISDQKHENTWESYIKKSYGPLGDDKFEKWKESQPNTEKKKQIIETLKNKWEYFQKLVRTVIPPIEDLEKLYENTGLPQTQEQMSYTSEIVKEAMLCSKDFDYVNKYSLLHLLGDLRILEKFI